MSADNRIAGALALFGALGVVVHDAGPWALKLVGAAAMAGATAGGYKLVSWAVHVLIVKLKPRSWPPPPL